jgi:hypothetical protein
LPTAATSRCPRSPITRTSVDRTNAVRVLEALAAGAADLGREGIDTTYGRGLVGASLKPGWE